MQCDWLASIYTYIDAYRYLYMRVYIFLIFFYLPFHEILTPDLYQNDMSCVGVIRNVCADTIK